MRRIGIYGGAFNPPHVGHIAGAQYALDALQLEKLLLIPSCVSPHKPLPENSPTADQRLEMLRRAVHDPRIEVSDLELARGGTSYTYETVEQVKILYPDCELVLLMGTDMFLSFDKWKNPDRILNNTSLAVMYRGEKQENKNILEKKETFEKQGAKVYLVENPVTAISSTDLRRMLHFRCADTFIPPAVMAFIQRNNLYGTGKNLRHLPEDKLCDVVCSLLDPKRIPHVLGCRDTAVELARIWGADETAAARAALLHDITKALGSSLQLTLCELYEVCPDDFSRRNPKILHAFTGSLVAERIFGESKTVVDAIRTHTAGKPNMNILQKIIYVADYMEPNRNFDGVDKLRELAHTDIDKALKMGLLWATDILRQQGREISPDSLSALQELAHISV